MPRKAAVKPQEDDPQPPTQTTINIPALGGPVTIRAISLTELVALRPADRNPLGHAFNVICAATISPALDNAACVAHIRRHGEAPLLRLVGTIIKFSGLDRALQLQGMAAAPSAHIPA